ncbi:MBL fold metallo-hydrolase [Nocardioides sp. AX2bis]|uniref:MBL fold metallo-hydrolase n=1 Tax=Nocardioides sp. AX2bis TaxID=2653157 RepID=UPI0012EF5C4E|nr:MBL fold metallo-hydrolase [Nocardioides sp. AX2bis]VXB51997.1 MBL fold metallo-hydrolase [Nocardioides sp. AX2bis]
MGDGTLAVTWWGHATTTVELGGARVLVDPVLTRSLLHLRRSGPLPTSRALDADVVLVSHLHHDHLHHRSLRRLDPAVPVVAPRGVLGGAGRWTRRLLGGRELVEVAPGELVEVAGVRIEVHAADHPGTRDPLRGRRTRARPAPPAIGFRLSAGAASAWYPGDTGPGVDLTAVAPVDLALVPIGGWGPTLGAAHLDPEQAATAVGTVGAGAALGVHHGTFWPVGLRAVMPARHRALFVEPGPRFAAALGRRTPGVRVLTPEPGERVVLSGSVGRA